MHSNTIQDIQRVRRRTSPVASWSAGFFITLLLRRTPRESPVPVSTQCTRRDSIARRDSWHNRWRTSFKRGAVARSMAGGATPHHASLSELAVALSHENARMPRRWLARLASLILSHELGRTTLDPSRSPPLPVSLPSRCLSTSVPLPFHRIQPGLCLALAKPLASQSGSAQYGA